MTFPFKVPGTDPAGRPAKRPNPRQLLTPSPASDVARAPWSPTPMIQRGSGGPYTDAVKSVEASYAPRVHSLYA